MRVNEILKMSYKIYKAFHRRHLSNILSIDGSSV